MRERGYPPSVREIGEAVGLTSPSTVHSHLNTLQRLGYPAARPDQAAGDRGRASTPTSVPSWSAGPSATSRSSATSPPAPTCSPQENVEELLPVPVDFTGDGELFMLRVRGDSMIDAGILDGDFVVATQTTADNGDIVVAGIPGDEATVKTYSRRGAEVTLMPANATMEPMVFTRRRGRDLRPGRHRDAPPLTVPRR